MLATIASALAVILCLTLGGIFAALGKDCLETAGTRTNRSDKAGDLIFASVFFLLAILVGALGAAKVLVELMLRFHP